VRISAALGHVSLATRVQFDPLGRDAEDFVRVDRMSASLELIDSAPLGSVHAIDDQGTVYYFDSPGTLTALALDGSTTWTGETGLTGGVDISVGPDEVWVASRAEVTERHLGGVRSFGRADGAAGVSLDFQLETSAQGEFREASVAIAAHPCGGASLLTATRACDRARSCEATMTALSRIESDGTRSVVALGLPYQQNIFGRFSGASTAADGASVALFHSAGGHQPVGY